MKRAVIEDADDLPAISDRAPEHGWDHAVDVREAKGLCRDMKWAAGRNKRGPKIIFDLAYKIRDYGISEALTADLIISICEFPFSKTEVQHEVHGAYRAAMNMPGLLSKARGTFVDDDSWLEAEEPSEDDLSWLEGGPAVWPKPLLYDAKQHSAKLAEMFLAERPAKLIVSDGVIYSLESEKIWHALPEDELAAEIRATDPTLVLDTPRIFGIINAIKLAGFTKARPFDWIDEPHDAPKANDLILFGNGLLDACSGVLSPHTGRYFATGIPDFQYDPAATCPTWDRCLAEWLDPSFHDTLMEFMGYVLTPDTRHEKLLALIGARRGGKSTVLRIMSWLCGASHVLSRTLNDLGSDFGLEGTLAAKLLIVPDASDTELGKRGATIDRLKCISGNDEVSINRKGLKIITAKLPARLAIAANRHPKFLDDSGALAARELVVVFERSFEGQEDRELSGKLRAELPGIANRALEGLRRLRANGRFTVGAKGLAAARELSESQSPALRFAKARLIVTGDPNEFTPLDDVFASYEEWAFGESLSGRERRNRDDFKNDIVSALMARDVRYDRRRWRDPNGAQRGNGRRVRGFTGLRLRKD